MSQARMDHAAMVRGQRIPMACMVHAFLTVSMHPAMLPLPIPHFKPYPLPPRKASPANPCMHPAMLPLSTPHIKAYPLLPRTAGITPPTCRAAGAAHPPASSSSSSGGGCRPRSSFSSSYRRAACSTILAAWCRGKAERAKGREGRGETRHR